jgi:hypothetical protein
LLRHLQSEHPLAFPDDRIRRTLERRVRQWRALNGPERDIIFRQTPEPGYMGQSDFTHADELGVTIAGLPFPHQSKPKLGEKSGLIKTDTLQFLAGSEVVALQHVFDPVVEALGPLPGR